MIYFFLETVKNPSLVVGFDERVTLHLSLSLDQDPSGMLNPISDRR